MMMLVSEPHISNVEKCFVFMYVCTPHYPQRPVQNFSLLDKAYVMKEASQFHEVTQFQKDKHGSCFSLSFSIPILDCHHTWCCCGTPSDFYCATQT
ncbi:hypothetical protein STEG23_027139, partial [Scotinomys teguina]